MQIAFLRLLDFPLLVERPFGFGCLLDVIAVDFLLCFHDSAAQLLQPKVFPQIDYRCPAFIDRFVDGCDVGANFLDVVC